MGEICCDVECGARGTELVDGAVDHIHKITEEMMPRSAGVQKYNTACLHPDCIIMFTSEEQMQAHFYEEHHDPVNHPKHYLSHPSGVECIEIVRHMPFNEGNVFKYLWRAGLKSNAPTLQDYKKAKWYLEDAIKLLEQEQNA